MKWENEMENGNFLFRFIVYFKRFSTKFMERNKLMIAKEVTPTCYVTSE